MGKRANGEGSVFVQADGRWVAKVTVNGRVRRFYARTQREALAKLKAARAAVDQGLPLPDARLTLGQFLQHWLDEVASARLRTYSPNVRPASMAQAWHIIAGSCKGYYVTQRKFLREKVST